MSEYDETTIGQARELAPIDDIAEEHVRKVLHEGRWWFAIIDVVGMLTESQTPRRYWTDMKRRLADTEGFSEVYAKCQQPTASNA